VSYKPPTSCRLNGNTQFASWPTTYTDTNHHGEVAMEGRLGVTPHMAVKGCWYEWMARSGLTTDTLRAVWGDNVRKSRCHPRCYTVRIVRVKCEIWLDNGNGMAMGGTGARHATPTRFSEASSNTGQSSPGRENRG
jgi:hypothetical protein